MLGSNPGRGSPASTAKPALRDHIATTPPRNACTGVSGRLLRHAIIGARVDDDRLADDVVWFSGADRPVTGERQLAGLVGRHREVTAITWMVGCRDWQAMIHHIGIPVSHCGRREYAVRPANNNAPIERRERLGGLLYFYYRRAA
jgi:hypothetical protein